MIVLLLKFWDRLSLLLVLLVLQAEELDAKLRRIIEEVPDNERSRMGSNAGANSKTFDQYRLAKQRELERVRKMEAEAAAEEKKRRFQVRENVCLWFHGVY